MRADFRLGEWIVRPQLRVIERGEESVHIKPKPMSVLECLAEADGRPVTRNELFDRVWHGGEVSDETLTKCIVELRKAFGDTARDSRVIRTIPKLGFCLAQPVKPLDPETPVANREAVQNPQYAHTKGKGVGRVAILAVAGVLTLVIILSFDSPRNWLAGIFNSSSLEKAGNLLPPSAERQTSIAVLPFVNMSSDPENEYFSLGVSEEILNALAATNFVPVIARTSSFRFNSEGEDIKDIGRLLNVSHVLEGSVRKANGRVRVSAQLVDTATGVHVWADSYQRDLSDILQVQEDITRQVVDQVSLALGGDLASLPANLPDMELVTARHTDSIEAYDSYLKGTQLLASHNPIPVEQAETYFDRAIALDSNYADAWAGKGRALHVRGLTTGGHPDMPASVFPRAIEAYRKALEINPRHAVAMGWLGVALMQNDFEWEQGLNLLEQSLEINPNNAAMLSRYGARLDRLNLEGSAEVMERAFRLDPFGLVPNIYRASRLQQEGRLVDAATVAEAALVGGRESYSLNFAAAIHNLGAAGLIIDDAQLRDARLQSAESQIRTARRVAHPVDFSLDFLEMVISALRSDTQLPWREILERAKQKRLNGLMLWAYYILPTADEKLAIEALDLAIAQRDPEVWLLFGPAPPNVPEAEWNRMREIAGVAQFMSAHRPENGAQKK